MGNQRIEIIVPKHIEFSTQARISQCESALTLTINFPHQQLLPAYL